MATKKTTKTSVQSPLSRPPVVVVLGHVDHGKTTLLDTIRKTDVAASEHGGITQSIGAYQVSVADGDNQKKITFIDTPGHEAFTKMRSQGANVADIAILVVAANDSVMPQTAESIKMIKEAKIPYIVAINKIDLPEANIDKVVADLLAHEVLLENYGGDIPFVKVSAKTGQGVTDLLALIELVSQMNEISGDPDGELAATIIESRMDKSRGAIATAIVKGGRLSVGEKYFIGESEFKVRALVAYTGENIKEATPGMPVEILGMATVPPVGAAISKSVKFQGEVLASDQKKETGGAENKLNLILRADTIGTLSAIETSLPTNTKLILGGVGDITEADILLAKSTGSIILGFNVKVSSAAVSLSESEKVLVRTYKIIYELLDELTDAAAGMLVPEEKEEILGTGQIIAEFPYEKMRIAGVKVIDGRMARGDLVRVQREDPEATGGQKTVGEGKIKSIRVVKEEVNKVEKGKDCGILVEPQVDFKPGDAIISYRLI